MKFGPDRHTRTAYGPLVLSKCASSGAVEADLLSQFRPSVSLGGEKVQRLSDWMDGSRQNLVSVSTHGRQLSAYSSRSANEYSPELSYMLGCSRNAREARWIFPCLTSTLPHRKLRNLESPRRETCIRVSLGVEAFGELGLSYQPMELSETWEWDRIPCHPASWSPRTRVNDSPEKSKKKSRITPDQGRKVAGGQGIDDEFWPGRMETSLEMGLSE